MENSFIHHDHHHSVTPCCKNLHLKQRDACFYVNFCIPNFEWRIVFLAPRNSIGKTVSRKISRHLFWSTGQWSVLQNKCLDIFTSQEQGFGICILNDGTHILPKVGSSFLSCFLVSFFALSLLFVHKCFQQNVALSCLSWFSFLRPSCSNNI